LADIINIKNLCNEVHVQSLKRNQDNTFTIG